jgi:hypothetical protein
VADPQASITLWRILKCDGIHLNKPLTGPTVSCSLLISRNKHWLLNSPTLSNQMIIWSGITGRDKDICHMRNKLICFHMWHSKLIAVWWTLKATEHKVNNTRVSFMSTLRARKHSTICIVVNEVFYAICRGRGWRWLHQASPYLVHRKFLYFPHLVSGPEACLNTRAHFSKQLAVLLLSYNWLLINHYKPKCRQTLATGLPI